MLDIRDPLLTFSEIIKGQNIFLYSLQLSLETFDLIGIVEENVYIDGFWFLKIPLNGFQRTFNDVQLSVYQATFGRCFSGGTGLGSCYKIL